jgi:hypothetical protein
VAHDAAEELRILGFDVLIALGEGAERPEAHRPVGPGAELPRRRDPGSGSAGLATTDRRRAFTRDRPPRARSCVRGADPCRVTWDPAAESASVAAPVGSASGPLWS